MLEISVHSKFPKLSESKLKERYFTGPDVRKLLPDSFIFQNNGRKTKRSM